MFQNDIQPFPHVTLTSIKAIVKPIGSRQTTQTRQFPTLSQPSIRGGIGVVPNSTFEYQILS